LFPKQGTLNTTPLLYAAGLGQFEVIKLLVQKGVDINEKVIESSFGNARIRLITFPPVSKRICLATQL
jgi:hypothetical protein